MGYDYDDTIRVLQQFNNERKSLLETALANGHHLAESVRLSIAKHDEAISKCEAMRDEQSA